MSTIELSTTPGGRPLNQTAAMLLEMGDLLSRWSVAAAERDRVVAAAVRPTDAELVSMDQVEIAARQRMAAVSPSVLEHMDHQVAALRADVLQTMAIALVFLMDAYPHSWGEVAGVSVDVCGACKAERPSRPAAWCKAHPSILIALAPPAPAWPHQGIAPDTLALVLASVAAAVEPMAAAVTEALKPVATRVASLVSLEDPEIAAALATAEAVAEELLTEALCSRVGGELGQLLTAPAWLGEHSPGLWNGYTDGVGELLAGLRELGEERDTYRTAARDRAGVLLLAVELVAEHMYNDPTVGGERLVGTWGELEGHPGGDECRELWEGRAARQLQLTEEQRQQLAQPDPVEVTAAPVRRLMDDLRVLEDATMAAHRRTPWAGLDVIGERIRWVIDGRHMNSKEVAHEMKRRERVDMARPISILRLHALERVVSSALARWSPARSHGLIVAYSFHLDDGQTWRGELSLFELANFAALHGFDGVATLSDRQHNEVVEYLTPERPDRAGHTAMMWETSEVFTESEAHRAGTAVSLAVSEAWPHVGTVAAHRPELAAAAGVVDVATEARGWLIAMLSDSEAGDAQDTPLYSGSDMATLELILGNLRRAARTAARWGAGAEWLAVERTTAQITERLFSQLLHQRGAVPNVEYTGDVYGLGLEE